MKNLAHRRFHVLLLFRLSRVSILISWTKKSFFLSFPCVWPKVKLALIIVIQVKRQCRKKSFPRVLQAKRANCTYRKQQIFPLFFRWWWTQCHLSEGGQTTGNSSAFLVWRADTKGRNKMSRSASAGVGIRGQGEVEIKKTILTKPLPSRPSLQIQVQKTFWGNGTHTPTHTRGRGHILREMVQIFCSREGVVNSSPGRGMKLFLQGGGRVGGK